MPDAGSLMILDIWKFIPDILKVDAGYLMIPDLIVDAECFK